jgi:hypothetical protein
MNSVLLTGKSGVGKAAESSLSVKSSRIAAVHYGYYSQLRPSTVEIFRHNNTELIKQTLSENGRSVRVVLRIRPFTIYPLIWGTRPKKCNLH